MSLRDSTSKGRPLFTKRKPVRRRANAQKKRKPTRKPPGKLFADNPNTLHDIAKEVQGTDFFFKQQITEDERQSREAALQQLQQDILDHRDSLPLMEYIDGEDNRIVFSRGSVDATLMVIGEAPGAQEAQSGQPFVGPSGQKLDEYLKKYGIDPETHIYVTNVVLVRPPNNRDPTWEELSAYMPFLRRHIAIIKPKVILCMGRFSSTVLRSGLGNATSIRGQGSDRVHGQHTVNVVNMNSFYQRQANMGALTLREERFCCQFYMAYHPSAILREAGDIERKQKAEPNTKLRFFRRERWENDFKTVAGALLEPHLEYIDAGELIRDTIPPGYVFNKPDEIFYAEPKLTAEQQQGYAQSASALEFEVHSIEYHKYENVFNIYGRTIDDHSVFLEVFHPEMRFWIGHDEIRNNEVSPTELKTLQDSINSALGTTAYGWRKYREMENMGSVDCALQLSEKRDYMQYNPHKSTYVEVSYHQQDLKFELRKNLETIWPGLEYYESDTPEHQLEYTNNIYVHGWVQITLDSSLKCRTQGRKSLADLEYTVDARDVVGYSPNPWDDEDEKWRRSAPLRLLSFDGEMLNTGGRFPRAEQDPVVSICAYGTTYNRADGRNFTEQVRNPAQGKSQEFRTTGRCNYDDAVVFAVGSVGDISTEKFHTSFLPNVPDPPIDSVIRLKNALSEDGSYKKSYVIGLRTWNVFIEQFQIWSRAVGQRRTARILNHDILYHALVGLVHRPDGTKLADDWTKSRVLEWEGAINTVRKLWHHHRKKDIRNLNEGKSWERDFEATEDEGVREREFGEIQSRWSIFRPKKRVFDFESEADMLRGYYNYVRQYDADVITGYNISAFDIPYCIRRTEVLDLRDEESGKLISMGRFRDREDTDTIKTSSSKATGERIYHTVDIPSRQCYDLLLYFMRDHKLPANQLAYVAHHFLKDTKNDVPYSAIPSLFRNNRERLNDYCLKDAELVVMLMSFLNNMNFLLALARLIGTMHMERLYVDGKQAQVFSCVKRFLCKEGRDKIIPDNNPYSQKENEGDEGIGYEGAMVFEPKTLGLYKKLLLCLDYVSLYPSIMIAFNLGHDMAGTAKHMTEVGVELKECFKTPRRFPVPELSDDELDVLSSGQAATLELAMQAYGDRSEVKLKYGQIKRTENNKHLVCPISLPKPHHADAEQFLTEQTKTSVKIKQDTVDGKKIDSFRAVLDIGEFYYFFQPRKLTESQLQESGIRKEDCRLRPGGEEFWVPQFGCRKRMNTQEVREYLLDTGLTGENTDFAMTIAYTGTVPLDERGRYEQLQQQLLELGVENPDEPLRYFESIPDIYLPKVDEAAIVGTELTLLAARDLVKKERGKYKPDSEMYKKLDSQQLALKILCNSLYGATGVRVGKLAGIHISATVTAEGKRTILELAEKIAEKFDGDTQGGDTDSVFEHIPSIQTLDQIYEEITAIDDRTGERIETTRVGEIVDFANTLVPPPMKIEFEKAYKGFFAVAKKRAAYVEYMPYWDSIEKRMKFDGEGEISFKGLETKRRDSCLIAQETITGFITRLLSEKDDEETAVANAVEYVRSQVEKVLDGDVPFHQMIQARQLSKKNYNSKLPHVELCKKKRKRNEPVPEVGSRVPFVVVTGSKGRKFYQSVEDPDYALEHGMRLNYEYLVDKKIRAPILRFTNKMPNSEKLDNMMFGNLRKRHRRNLQDDDPLAGFVQQVYACAECGRHNPALVCSDCGPSANWHQLWTAEVIKRDAIGNKHADALKTCRACMSIGDTEEVVCGNTTCSEYFPRRGSFFDGQNQGKRMREIKQLQANYVLDPDMEW